MRWSCDHEQRGAAVVICHHCGAHRPAHEPAGNCCKNGALCSLPEWLPPDANSSEPSVRAARAIYDMWRADDIEGKLLRQYALTVNNALAVSFLRYSSLDAAGNVIAPQGGLQGQQWRSTGRPPAQRRTAPRAPTAIGCRL